MTFQGKSRYSRWCKDMNSKCMSRTCKVCIMFWVTRNRLGQWRGICIRSWRHIHQSRKSRTCSAWQSYKPVYSRLCLGDCSSHWCCLGWWKYPFLKLFPCLVKWHLLLSTKPTRRVSSKYSPIYPTVYKWPHWICRSIWWRSMGLVSSHFLWKYPWTRRYSTRSSPFPPVLS